MAPRSGFSAVVPMLYHASTVGSALAMFYFARPGSSLFPWHPFLMTTAVGCLMAEGLMILTDDFSIVPIAKRSGRVTVHWIIQGSSIVALFVGFTAVYMTKNQNAKPHFTSWHGYLGLMTVIAATSASVGGNILKYRVPVPFVPTKTLKLVHALAGKAVLLTGCVVITLGLGSDWAAKQVSGGGGAGPLVRYGVGAAVLYIASNVINEMRKIFSTKMAAKSKTSSKKSSKK